MNFLDSYNICERSGFNHLIALHARIMEIMILWFCVLKRRSLKQFYWHSFSNFSKKIYFRSLCALGHHNIDLWSSTSLFYPRNFTSFKFRAVNNSCGQWERPAQLIAMQVKEQVIIQVKGPLYYVGAYPVANMMERKREEQKNWKCYVAAYVCTCFITSACNWRMILMSFGTVTHVDCCPPIFRSFYVK